MNVEIFSVEGFDHDDEEDRRAAALTDQLGTFEMPSPPQVGEIVEWEVSDGSGDDDPVYFLTGVVTARTFHFESRHGRRGVTCRLNLRLVDEAQGVRR